MKKSHCIETDEGISFGFDKEDVLLSLPDGSDYTILWQEWDEIVEFINSLR